MLPKITLTGKKTHQSSLGLNFVMDTETGNIDEWDTKWMKLALLQSKTTLDQREVPVGCIIVLPAKYSPTGTDQVVASSGNETNESGNGTRHGKLFKPNEIAFVMTCFH